MDNGVFWYWVLYKHGDNNYITQVSRTEYEPDITTFPSDLTYAEISKSLYDSIENYLEYNYNADGTISEINHDQNMSNYQRFLRDNLLLETDKYAVGDRSMSDEMRNYRQALRDVPQQSGFPDNITWPTKP